jgi:hypothetical protein
VHAKLGRHNKCFVALPRIDFRDLQPQNPIQSFDATPPLNRPHPSPHLAEMGVRSAHARARAGHARAPRTDTGQGPNVWYVVVCSVCSGGAARRARPRRPRAGLAGPASGRGGKGRSAFRLLTRPGFVNCDTLCFVNCGATASAPSLQMEMNLLTTRQPRKNTITTTTRSRELIQ